jgi:hypothetical protein
MTPRSPASRGPSGKAPAGGPVRFSQVTISLFRRHSLLSASLADLDNCPRLSGHRQHCIVCETHTAVPIDMATTRAVASMAYSPVHIWVSVMSVMNNDDLTGRRVPYQVCGGSRLRTLWEPDPFLSHSTPATSFVSRTPQTSDHVDFTKRLQVLDY